MPRSDQQRSGGGVDPLAHVAADFGQWNTIESHRMRFVQQLLICDGLIGNLSNVWPEEYLSILAGRLPLSWKLHGSPASAAGTGGRFRGGLIELFELGLEDG